MHRQNDLNWCLQKIIDYWKQPFDLMQQEVWQDIEDPKLCEYLYQLGFGMMKYQDFNNFQDPRIVRGFDGRYQVLLSISSQAVQMLGQGLPKLNLAYHDFLHQNLQESWLIYPLSLKCSSTNVSKQIFKHFLQLLGLTPSYALGVGVIVFSYECLTLVEPILLNLVILHVDLLSSSRDLFLTLVAIVLILALGLILGLFRQKLWVWFFGKLSLQYTRDVLIQLLSRPFLNIKTAEVYSRFYNLEQMIYRYLQQICFSVLDVLFLILHWLGMAYFDWRLALVDLVFLSFSGIIGMQATQRYYLKYKAVLELQHQYAGHLLDSLHQLPLVQRNDIQTPIFKRCYQPKLKYWQAFLSAEWLQNGFEWVLSTLRKLNTVVLLGLGLFLILKHQLSVGGMLGFWILKTQLSGRFEILSKRMLQFYYLRAPLDKLADLFRTGFRANASIIKHQTMHAKIDLLYPKIRDICYPKIELHWGKHYWLQGISGSGKTTLLLALAGLIPISEGEIHVQGFKRQDLVFVLQTDQLFKASVMDNLSLFAENVDSSRIQEVIRLVDLEDLISSLKDGYATQVGPEGVQLSAGQIQRLLIARSLYQEPKWLILDEATCHLDLAAEALIIQRLMKLPLSLIMVNHREDYADLFDERISLSS